MQALTGGSLRAEVRLALSLAGEHIVLLRYTFVRCGVTRSYETVSWCMFENGLLRGWSVYPSNLTEYRRAWMNHPHIENYQSEEPIS